MQEFKVENHESSLLPDGKKWKLVWSDEFDGTEIDRTKWDYRLYMMGKRNRTWQEEGAELDGNSNIVFRAFEKDGEICSTQLQTGYNYMDGPTEPNPSGFTWPISKLKEHKFLHRYGYYECRCKLQKKPGWWTAFWMQSPVIGSSLDPETAGIEHDIMESFVPGTISMHVNHYNGYGVDHKQVIHGEGMNISLDEYHRFGLLWTEKGYTYYVDGKEDGHSDSPVSKIPEFLILSTEINGYREAGGGPTEEAKLAVGDEFVVDYVRVFDEVE